MTVIGFTGAHEATGPQIEYVRHQVFLLEAETYVTGACTGVDEAVALAVADMWPTSRNVIVVPADRSQVTRGFVEYMAARPGVEIVCMPEGSTCSQRNRQIVRLSDRLVGFPPFVEDHPACARSGTWQTVRMARRAGMPIELHILTELRRFTEGGRS